MIQSISINSKIINQDESGEGSGGIKSILIDDVGGGGNDPDGGDGSGGGKAKPTLASILKKIPKTLKGKRVREHNSCNDFYIKPKYKTERKDISHEFKSFTKF